jgi:ribosomal protein S27AE
MLNTGDDVEEQMKAAQRRYEERLARSQHRACSRCGATVIRIASKNKIRGVDLARFRCPRCNEEVDVFPI